MTSSVKEEGKSLTSLNLAVTLAKDVDCKSVLLVDCDLRRGALDASLDLNLKVGLSDYLFLGADVESILYKTKIDKHEVGKVKCECGGEFDVHFSENRKEGDL